MTAPRAPLLHWSAVAVLVLLLPMGFLTWRAYGSWRTAQARASELAAEEARLKASNALLSRAHQTLQNRKFQVCNKSADEVEVTWFSAAYESRGRLEVFDTARCQGFLSQLVAPGGSPRLFTFSSPQEGCNWDGSVVFYALRFTRTTEDGGTFEYSMVGPWQGFERDCFTIQ